MTKPTITEKLWLVTPLLFFISTIAYAQNLGLRDAIDKGSNNYGLVAAKNKYAEASKETVKQIKRQYLPNLSLSAQQDYGTVNGQNGPLYGFGGLGVASSGLPLPQQNWNAAFGGLYLANINWEFYNFGRTRQSINLAKAESLRLQKDYEQEHFQQKIKIAATYLNLLASQRLQNSQQKNLHRAETFYNNIAQRVKNGLLPGVDEKMASAEVSKAKITLNQIKEQVKNQNNQLAQLMGEEPQTFKIDSTFINKIPVGLLTTKVIDSDNHLTRQYFKSRIDQSKEQEKLFKKEYLPSFSFFGVYQTRASGFSSDYATNQTAFSQNYIDGINPTRQNYLLGIGGIWNLSSILRSAKKVSSQKLITEGLEQEYKTIDVELRNNEDTANSRIELAIQNYNEAPIQVNAAQQAYLQQSTLYKNGLTTFTDVASALFNLNRAETDRDIAFANVWQALLMKAAAIGDFNMFLNEF